MKIRMRIAVLIVFALHLGVGPAAYSQSPGEQTAQTMLPALPPSMGSYRLPFADGTSVKVFDDFYTHRPVGRIDFFAVGGSGPCRVVAAAAGRVVAIQDSFNEQQSGRAAADCHNNYIWIAHPNGEWTNYSHLAHNSVTVGAKLKVGDQVAAGTYLGDEDAVGCAMLKHVHFEVAIPDPKTPIDSGGFLTDNDGGKRERDPKFCRVPEGVVRKDSVYEAHPC
jgi:murein DD-endopeptidase MepM/ murein hydrolase activator NlpD